MKFAELKQKIQSLINSSVEESKAVYAIVRLVRENEKASCYAVCLAKDGEPLINIQESWKDVWGRIRGSFISVLRQKECPAYYVNPDTFQIQGPELHSLAFKDEEEVEWDCWKLTSIDDPTLLSIEKRRKERDRKKVQASKLAERNARFIKILYEKLQSIYLIPESVPGHFYIEEWAYVKSHNRIELTVSISLGLDSLEIIREAIQETGQELERETGIITVIPKAHKKLAVSFTIH